MENKKLSITKVSNDICGCNSCGNRNYESKYPAMDGNIVDAIYEVRIGIMCNRICGDCLRKLALDAAAELWVPVYEDKPTNPEERVLVCCEGSPGIDTDRFVNGRWVRYDKDATHWLPLPKGAKLPEPEAEKYSDNEDDLPPCTCGGKAMMVDSFNSRGNYSVVMCSKCCTTSRKSFLNHVKFARREAAESWRRMVENGE